MAVLCPSFAIGNCPIRAKHSREESITTHDSDHLRTSRRTIHCRTPRSFVKVQFNFSNPPLLSLVPSIFPSSSLSDHFSFFLFSFSFYFFLSLLFVLMEYHAVVFRRQPHGNFNGEKTGAWSSVYRWRKLFNDEQWSFFVVSFPLFACQLFFSLRAKRTGMAQPAGVSSAASSTNGILKTWKGPSTGTEPRY